MMNTNEKLAGRRSRPVGTGAGLVLAACGVLASCTQSPLDTARGEFIEDDGLGGNVPEEEEPDCSPDKPIPISLFYEEIVADEDRVWVYPDDFEKMAKEVSEENTAADMLTDLEEEQVLAAVRLASVVVNELEDIDDALAIMDGRRFLIGFFSDGDRDFEFVSYVDGDTRVGAVFPEGSTTIIAEISDGEIWGCGVDLDSLSSPWDECVAIDQNVISCVDSNMVMNPEFCLFGDWDCCLAENDPDDKLDACCEIDSQDEEIDLEMCL